MKEIKLINSKKKALCDDEDHGWLRNFNWYEDESGFAFTYIKEKAGHSKFTSTISMAALITIYHHRF